MRCYRIPVNAEGRAPARAHFFHHEADDAPVARAHGDSRGMAEDATVYELPTTLAHAWERVPAADERAAAAQPPVASDGALISVIVSVPDGYGLEQRYAPRAIKYLPPPAAVGADGALVFDLARALRQLHLPGGRAVPHELDVTVPAGRVAYQRSTQRTMAEATDSSPDDAPDPDYVHVRAILDTKAHGAGAYLLYPSPHAIVSLDVDADHAVVGGHLQLLPGDDGGDTGHAQTSTAVGAVLIGESLPVLRSNASAILGVLRRKLDAAELALALKTEAGVAQAREHLEAAERAATRYKKNAKKYAALRKSQQKGVDKRSRKQKLLDKIRRIKRETTPSSLPKLDEAEFDTLRTRLKQVKKDVRARAKDAKATEKAAEKAAKAAEKAAKAAEKDKAKEAKDKARLAKEQEAADKAQAKDAARAAKARDKADAQARKDAAKQAEAERKAREAARKGEREGLKEAAETRRAALRAQRQAAKDAEDAARAQRRATEAAGREAREAARAATLQARSGGLAPATAAPTPTAPTGTPTPTPSPTGPAAPPDLPPPLPETAAEAARLVPTAVAQGDTRVLELDTSGLDATTALDAVLRARAEGALLRVRALR